MAFKGLLEGGGGGGGGGGCIICFPGTYFNSTPHSINYVTFSCYGNVEQNRTKVNTLNLASVSLNTSYRS